MKDTLRQVFPQKRVAIRVIVAVCAVIFIILCIQREPDFVWRSIKFGAPQVYPDDHGQLDPRIIRRAEIYCDGVKVTDSSPFRLPAGKVVKVSGEIELAPPESAGGIQYSLFGNLYIGVFREDLSQTGISMEGRPSFTGLKEDQQHQSTISIAIDWAVPEYHGEAVMAISVQLEKVGYRESGRTGWPLRTVFAHPVSIGTAEAPL